MSATPIHDAVTRDIAQAKEGAKRMAEEAQIKAHTEKRYRRDAVESDRNFVGARNLFFALLAAAVVLAGLAWGASAARATDAGPLVCEGVPAQSETQYKYTRTVETTTSVTEYRWEAVFKSGKELKGWYVTGSNTWHEGDPGTWYELPASKQPDRFDGIAPTGTVPLSVYGGPSGKSAAYRYGVSHTVQFPEDGSWTRTSTPPAAPSGSSWGAAITRTVTILGEPTTETTGWLTEAPAGEGWSVLKEKQVETAPAVPAAWQQDDPSAACYNGPAFLSSSHTTVCGSVTITLRNVSAWIYPMSVEISRDGGATWGEHSYGPTVDNRTDGGVRGPIKDATTSRTMTFSEDENDGSVLVRYRVQAGTERDLYVGHPVGEWTVVEVGTDCEAPPLTVVDLPAVPGVVDPCGEGNAVYGDLVDTAAYSWSRAEDGSVTATVNDGYSFAEGGTFVTFPAPTETNVDACEPEPTDPPTTDEPTTPGDPDPTTPAEPEPTAPVEPEPSSPVDAEPTLEPTVTPHARVVTPDVPVVDEVAQAEQLAETGAQDRTGWLGVAVTLLLGGGVMTLVSRRNGARR